MSTIPAVSYRWPELRRLCQRISRTVGSIKLAGHVLEVSAVRPYQVDAGWRISPHAHSFYEAHVFLQGSGTYTMHGEHAIHPGTVIFHGPNVLHSWLADAPALRIVFFFHVTPEVSVPITSEISVWPSLVADVIGMLDDANVALPGWRDRINFRMSTILSQLLAKADWNMPNEPEPDTDDTMLTVVDHFLHDNLALPLTVADIAAHVGMSESSVAHQFSKATGESVMQRLYHLRMTRAAELLIETDAPLSTICQQVGIPDPSYFCRRFRRYFGFTPNGYRREMTRGGAQIDHETADSSSTVVFDIEE